MFGEGQRHLQSPSSRDGWFDRAVVAAMAKDPTMPRVTPHDLRHTAASLAISAGANVKAVQRMLGPKSAAMTLDTYSDLFDDDLDAVGVALDQARTASSVGKMWARTDATGSVIPLLPRDAGAVSA
ncbi:tyrosine-type recombinase/integrase [Clavibacter michiganensis]|uniref:tyrosine-type recombinase/integrase n=1 Tax=Clavibacter michiganensis TaxID=28447 RepID=UPI003CCFB83E